MPWHGTCKKPVMRSILYILGTLVLLAGVLYGASAAGVPQVWLIVIGLVIAGLGIMGASRSAATTTRAVETTASPHEPPRTRETTVSRD
jgi:hypothetical protein